MSDTAFTGLRRRLGRVPLEGLCNEIVDNAERYALVVDLSEEGVRLQRPPGRIIPNRLVQLEFELPGFDDYVWASGEVCFDQLWSIARGAVGRPQLVRTSGIRIVAAAERHRRLLRDYVIESRRALALDRALARSRLCEESDLGVPYERGGWLLQAQATRFLHG